MGGAVPQEAQLVRGSRNKENMVCARSSKQGEKKKPDIHSSKESLRPIWRPKKVEEFNSGAKNNQNWDFFFVDRRDFLPRRSQVGKKMKS